MHLGLMTECDYRAGRTQREAFDEAFTMAETAETEGFDGVWLAERHFAPPGGPGPIPSVASAPIVWASAIAARTSRLRIGTAVLVLPLGHPVRMAEEIATLDNISQGRVELGIGRSSFPRSYEGYDIPYVESRARFEEFLQVMQLAFTQERFSYSGKYYTFREVCLIPKPYQQPHPPLRAAATTRDTYGFMGSLGLPIFASLGAAMVEDIAEGLVEYRTAWRAAGHAGDGDVILRLPIYVAPTTAQALAQPKDSAMHHYTRLQQAFLRSAGSAEGNLRATRAARLATLTYEDIVQERAVFGTPEQVMARLRHLQQCLGLSGFIMESNVGGAHCSGRGRAVPPALWAGRGAWPEECLTMGGQPLLTTVVGSYPQPGWLIDRVALASSGPPRIRAASLWRIPDAHLEEAQDDATLVAMRDMERAGVDIISDGEIRRESYSNRFATALEGVDPERPGQIPGRGGQPTLVPRVVGPIRRVRPIQVRDVEFLRANTTRRIKVTVPGPFTMAQQAQNDYYPDRESLAMDYAACVNAEVRDLYAAGADVVQLDEPWLRTDPEAARAYGMRAINAALAGIAGPTALHLCFGYAAVVQGKPSQYGFLGELEDTVVQQISFEAAETNLDLAVLQELPSKTIILGVLDLSTMAVETPESIASRLREALRYVPPERLMVAPDCGMKYLPRTVAYQKLRAMTLGAAIVRASLHPPLPACPR